jgi:phosphatidylserine/phosphatidylglycerophosphate/cardiolipin synthase-like enzyme
MDPEDLDKLRKLDPAAATPPKAGAMAIPAAATRPTASAADPGPAQVQPAAATAVTATVLPGVSQAEVREAERRPLDLRSVTLTWAPSLLMVDQPGKIGPGDDEVNAGETVVDGLLTLMRQARRDVLVVSPYFVPGAQMMGVFEELRQRGVRIRVLTNSLASNDAPAAHAGYARYRPRLVALGVELYEMRSDPEAVAELLGSSGGRKAEGKHNFGLGSGPGGSKAGTRSRASLHSKAVFIDGALAVIGSMNLDLRSQLKNSEVALVIRSTALTREATRQVENTFAEGAYRVEVRDGKLHWRAPPGARFGDARSEPDASNKLKLLVKLIGPFAPDEML